MPDFIISNFEDCQGFTDKDWNSLRRGVEYWLARGYSRSQGLAQRYGYYSSSMFYHLVEFYTKVIKSSENYWPMTININLSQKKFIACENIETEYGKEYYRTLEVYDWS